MDLLTIAKNSKLHCNAGIATTNLVGNLHGYGERVLSKRDSKYLVTVMGERELLSQF